MTNNELFIRCDDRFCQVGKNQWTMNPIKEETYTFLAEFLPEVWETFSDQYMHFGGDEASDDNTPSPPLSHFFSFGIKLEVNTAGW